MSDTRRYSWEEAKGPRAFDILDATPGPEKFIELSDRADALASQVHNEAGVMKLDASSAQLAELAEIYEHIGKFESVEYVLDRAAELEGREGDEHDRIAWAIWRARTQFRVGRPDAAKAPLERELEQARKVGARDGASELLTALGLVNLADGHILAGLDLLDESFGLAREIKSTPAKAHALSAVGIAYALQGSRETEAIDILNRASLLHQRTGDRNSLAKIYNNIGVVLHSRGVFVDAIPRLELGLDFCSAAPDLLTVINSLSNNIRAYELHYMEGAGRLRDALTSLVERLPDVDKPRREDKTLLPLGEVLTGEEASFRNMPVLREAVLFVSLQPTRSLGPHGR